MRGRLLREVEMMLRKMTVLAMAIGVVAAFALPASASASWKHHGVAIQVDKDISLTGKFRTQAGIGGIECQVTTTVTFFAGQTTGIIDTFDVHPQDETTDCKGLGGLAPCQIHNLTPQQNTNWSFHTEAWQTVTAVQGQQTTFGATHQKALVITPQTLQYQMTGGIFCLVKKVQYHLNKIGLTEEGPGDGNTITNLDVNGSALSTTETNSGALDQEETLIQGTLQVEPPNQNTYDF
jgi:hypothetical protein